LNQHWFAPLVSEHQSFDIQTLSAADIHSMMPILASDPI
jgi:hypothetical protein